MREYCPELGRFVEQQNCPGPTMNSNGSLNFNDPTVSVQSNRTIDDIFNGVSTLGNIFVGWQQAQNQPDQVTYVQNSNPLQNFTPTSQTDDDKKGMSVWLIIAIVVVLAVLAIIIF